MDFLEWESFYFQILREFGFSRVADERSADALATIASDMRVCAPDCLAKRIRKSVTVCGFGPNLERDLKKYPPVGTIIAADGATSVLMRKGLFRKPIVPDIIVSDLDGIVEDQLTANALGAVEVILAHGDNIRAIEHYAPRFKGLITPTTQSTPEKGVFNFGGFTDGDRAVMLARHFGAKKILLLGFDFRNPREQPGKDNILKERKLKWAKRLIVDNNPRDVDLLIP